VALCMRSCSAAANTFLKMSTGFSGAILVCGPIHFQPLRKRRHTPISNERSNFFFRQHLTLRRSVGFAASGKGSDENTPVPL